MKLVLLKNTSGKRLAFPVRGTDGQKLVLNPGEAKNVSPATVKHPAVSRYIGLGLEVEGDSAAAAPKQKEPEPAPAPPQAPPAEPTSEAEPSEDESESEPEEPADEPAGDTEDLRGLYLTGPGVTEDNVDALLEKYSTIEALAKGTKGAVIQAGVSKSFAGRLLSWAADQQ
jgi:hypothetical protein